MFELLAYLLVELKKQVRIHETLNKEQTRISMIPFKEVVRIKPGIGLEDST